MWFKWVVIAWWVFNAAAYAGIVGKERKPVTGDEAAFAILLYAVFCAGLLFYWR